MTVFRWTLGILTLLLGGSMALTFMLFVANGNDEWMKLTRRLRHWASMALLFWFNIEIWRTVALVIIHW
jgi:hypothetical protein